MAGGDAGVPRSVWECGAFPIEDFRYVAENEIDAQSAPQNNRTVFRCFACRKSRRFDQDSLFR